MLCLPNVGGQTVAAAAKGGGWRDVCETMQAEALIVTKKSRRARDKVNEGQEQEQQTGQGATEPGGQETLKDGARARGRAAEHQGRIGCPCLMYRVGAQ